MHGALSLVLLLGGVNAAASDIGRPPQGTLADRSRCRATHRRRSGRRGPAARLTGRRRARQDGRSTAPGWTARSTRWTWRPASRPVVQPAIGPRRRAACSCPAIPSSPPARGPRAGCMRSIEPPASGTGGPRPGRWGRRWRWWTAPPRAPHQRGQLLGLDPADGSLRWRIRMGMARIAPVTVGRGAVVVATVDSLFRVTVAEGEVTHRVPSPGTIVSPWLVHRGLLVAGTTDSQVVAVSTRGPHDSVERQGGRAGPGLTGGAGRYDLRREPARHALPSGPRNRAGARAGRRARLAGDRARHGIRRPPSARRGRRDVAGARARTEPRCGGFSSGVRSSSVRWRWMTASSRSAATATFIGTGNESRPRASRTRADAPARPSAPVSSAAQESRPLVRYGKWVLAAGAVTMNLLAAQAHSRADDAFDAIEDALLRELDPLSSSARMAPMPTR